jgi:hypothetical protein
MLLVVLLVHHGLLDRLPCKVRFSLLHACTWGLCALPSPHPHLRHLMLTICLLLQRFPAGNHVVQSRRDTGLAEWLSEAQAQGRPLGGPGADPVLWYTWWARGRVLMVAD